MRIEFDIEIFTKDAPVPPVISLLECVTAGRHDWVADPETLDAADSYFRVHVPTMRSGYSELGRKGAVDASWRPVTGNDARVRIMLDDVADVAADLCRSAVLVIEDQQSDGCFVRSIARVFARNRILTALKNDWLVLRHAGGERIVNVAEADRLTFRRLVRVVALLDSDRWLPHQRTVSHDKADQLRRMGVQVHVLELREAENYVPNRILHAVGRPSESSRRLDSLKRLTPEQRGHYDMKHGFRQRGGAVAVRGEQRELFRDLDKDTMHGLAEGFGSKLLAMLERECGRLALGDFTALGNTIVAELTGLLSMIDSVI